MHSLDLFAGIGGITLALERAGVQSVAFCEREPFPIKVLNARWPRIPVYDDVCTMTGGDLPSVNIIAGGFPCQSFSLAGSRKGTEDERFLWPEMARLVAELRPRYVIGENVRGLLTIEDGMVFGQILNNLADMGYSVAWTTYSTDNIGGPHGRERVFILATNESCDDGELDPNLLHQEMVGWLAHDCWPCTPGYYQYQWEPLRLSTDRSGRAPRLKALGNAVVPAQIFPAVVALIGAGNRDLLNLNTNINPEWADAVVHSRGFADRARIAHACFRVVSGSLGEKGDFSPMYSHTDRGWTVFDKGFGFVAQPVVKTLEWPSFGFYRDRTVYAYDADESRIAQMSDVCGVSRRVFSTDIKSIGWLETSIGDKTLCSHRELAKKPTEATSACSRVKWHDGMWDSPMAIVEGIAIHRRERHKLVFSLEDYERAQQEFGKLEPSELWPTARSSAIDSTRRPGTGGRIIGEEALRWAGYRIYGEERDDSRPKVNPQWLEVVMGFPPNWTEA